MNLTLIKRIAKQGKNLVVIIPKDLHPFLASGDLVQMNLIKIHPEVKA